PAPARRPPRGKGGAAAHERAAGHRELAVRPDAGVPVHLTPARQLDGRAVEREDRARLRFPERRIRAAVARRVRSSERRGDQREEDGEGQESTGRRAHRSLRYQRESASVVAPVCSPYGEATRGTAIPGMDYSGLRRRRFSRMTAAAS